MKKIKLLLEYDGTAYQGWQIQKECITIQGIIEEKILKITGERSRVIGAGRTDAGVHALGQVAAFRTISRLEPEAMKRALNALLPYDIRVIETSEVNDSFHPIYDAVKKSYFYIIANQREFPAFLYRYAWIVRQPLEMKYMIEAAQTLIGRHDFSSFMGTGSSIKDPEREIFSLSLDKLDNIDFMTASMRGEFIKIGIEANGFLRHMVRNIAGTLVEIGRGRISPDRMKEILELHDRKCAGQTAPPNGLFLGRIMYY
jgi:tRNA pseudouridine38-40 synthase